MYRNRAKNTKAGLSATKGNFRENVVLLLNKFVDDMEKAEIFNAFFALVLTDNPRFLRPGEKSGARKT